MSRRRREPGAQGLRAGACGAAGRREAGTAHSGAAGVGLPPGCPTGRPRGGRRPGQGRRAPWATLSLVTVLGSGHPRAPVGRASHLQGGVPGLLASGREGRAEQGGSELGPRPTVAQRPLLAPQEPECQFPEPPLREHPPHRARVPAALSKSRAGGGWGSGVSAEPAASERGGGPGGPGSRPGGAPAPVGSPGPAPLFPPDRSPPPLCENSLRCLCSRPPACPARPGVPLALGGRDAGKGEHGGLCQRDGADGEAALRASWRWWWQGAREAGTLPWESIPAAQSGPGVGTGPGAAGPQAMTPSHCPARRPSRPHGLLRPAPAWR